jgi:hypothetical protein
MVACGDHELRGRVELSKDGRTYLVVADDNGGGCGPILVDGKRWLPAIGAPGSIAPGDHTISCGGDIQFHIDSGKTFHFDYWGP